MTRCKTAFALLQWLAMEFGDTIERYKKAMRESIPEDAWQNDVSAWMRYAISQELRVNMRPMIAGKEEYEGIHGRMVSRIRTDLGGKYGLAGPDVADGEVVSLLRKHPSLGEDDALPDILEQAIRYSSYKFARWGELTKLEELVDICEGLPPDAQERAKIQLKELTSFTLHVLTAMECDSDTKQNFRQDQRLARERGRLKSLFMRLWDMMNPQEQEEE